MDNSNTCAIAKSLPAILIGGAPKAGKSILAYNLTKALRKRDVPHYVFRANPDGEGDWFLEGESEAIRQFRIKGKWSDTFRSRVCQDLSRRLLPLIVDIGGLPKEDDNCIISICTHSILLLKSENEQATQTWSDFTISNRLIPIAELHAQQQGHSERIEQKPVLTGTIIIPKPRMRMYGKVFNELVDSVAELFSTYSLPELEREHLKKAQTEYIVHLREELEELAPGNEDWTLDLLEPLLSKLSTQTPFSVYERGPGWLYGALALHAQKQPFYQFDSCMGWVAPPVLQSGTLEQVPEDLMHIKSETSGDAFVMTISLTHYYIDYREADKLIFPELPPELGVIVSGKLPLWLFTALARFYAEKNVPWIALNDARYNQACVIYSRVPNHTIGDVLDV